MSRLEKLRAEHIRLSKELAAWVEQEMKQALGLYRVEDEIAALHERRRAS